MKNAFKPTAILLIALSTLLACKKKTADPIETIVDDKDLTGCPVGTTCYYQYVNKATMLDRQITLTTGQYRVFWSKNIGYGARSFYFLAPMMGDNFVLNDKDVAEGRVKYVSDCPSCLSISLKALTGTVKGIRVTKTSVQGEKWLVESNIVLAVEGTTTPFDTVHVKQYYFPAVQ
ncbi:hypothetical protein ASE74_21740 [Pedobacter sp. Leaf216]|uniref:hypothetical protein n=1 Tax=Pedobacter sp. Leaf216 TaxID=1735684 RepID=UPI0006F3F0B1|nr:hypothetical protein [Pedobacter sp. Leaf216]KQM72924.1 hypothetical protein ASE74_21740 [Pedobacter sp. Leaf216]